MVPEGWEARPLSECLEKVIDYRGKAPPKTETGVRLITARNVRMGYVSMEHAEYIDEHQYAGWMNRGLPTEGDIMFTTEAPLGNVALFPLTGVFALGQRIVTLRVNETCKSGFLFQFLLSEQGQGRIHSKSSGSTALGIKSRELVKVVVPTPPLPEQQKIADILSTWDQAIEKTEALLSNARTQKRALMQQLLTGKRRFPAYQGQPWKEVRLGDVAAFIKDGTHGTHKRYDQGVKMISAVNIRADHTIELSSAPHVSEADYQQIHKKYEIAKDDILLTVVGTIGRSAIVKGDQRFTAQRSVAIIRMKDASTAEFTHQYFQSNQFQNDLFRRANITAQPGVYLGEIAKVMVPVLSESEQRRINEALHLCDLEIDENQHSITKLRTEKKALMQQLLTGKRRVVV